MLATSTPSFKMWNMKVHKSTQQYEMVTMVRKQNIQRHYLACPSRTMNPQELGQKDRK